MFLSVDVVILERLHNVYNSNRIQSKKGVKNDDMNFRTLKTHKKDTYIHV